MTVQKSAPGERRTAQKPVLREHGNAYNIFILVLTIYSLALMLLLVLPVDDDTRQLANWYDNLICVVFLVDFFYNLLGAKPRRAYFIGQNGWVDLLGSIPSFSFFPYAALFRLFRVFRLFRIAHMLRRQNQHELLADVVRNRSQYAFFITVILALLVLVTGSILVLQFESASPDANITTGGDATWWAIVTITTVGYGDHFPVTPLGRITAAFLMFAGIGIIGALASILASVLVGSPPVEATEETGAEQAAEVSASAGAATERAGAASSAAPAPDVAAELSSLRAEVAALRAWLEQGRGPAD